LFTVSIGLPCAHTIQDRLRKDGVLNLSDFHRHWFFVKPPEENSDSRTLLRQIDLVMDPFVVKAKGRSQGAVGKTRKNKRNTDKSTERNSSQFKRVHAEVTGDGSQLKGIHRKPRQRRRLKGAKTSHPSQILHRK
jgi:hypothetical protein